MEEHAAIVHENRNVTEPEKRTRSKRREEQKLRSNYFIKSSLKSRLKRKDKDVIPTIIDWVRKISKITAGLDEEFNFP